MLLTYKYYNAMNKSVVPKIYFRNLFTVDELRKSSGITVVIDNGGDIRVEYFFI